MFGLSFIFPWLTTCKESIVLHRVVRSVLIAVLSPIVWYHICCIAPYRVVSQWSFIIGQRSAPQGSVPSRRVASRRVASRRVASLSARYGVVRVACDVLPPNIRIVTHSTLSR